MARRSVRVVLPVFVAVVLGWASATVRGQAIHRPYSLDPCPGGQGLSTSDNPFAGKCSAFDQTGDLPDGGGPDVAGPDAGGGSDAMRLRLMSIFDERRLSRLGCR